MGNKNQNYPLTFDEFKSIYSKVPRLTVEVIVKSDEGVLLSLRDIEPYKGYWHLPGGTVLFGEKLADAVKRVAKKELNVDVTGEPEFMGYLEYSKYMDEWFDDPVGMAFMIGYEGELRPNDEATDLKWFAKLPERVPPDQADFINSKVLR